MGKRQLRLASSKVRKKEIYFFFFVMEEYRSRRKRSTDILKKLKLWHRRYYPSPSGIDFKKIDTQIAGADMIVKLANNGARPAIYEILQYLTASELAFLDAATNINLLPNYTSQSFALSKQIFWTNTVWDFEPETLRPEDRIECPLELSRLQELETGEELQEEIFALTTVENEKDKFVSEVTILDPDIKIKNFSVNPIFPLAAVTYEGRSLIEVIAYGSRPREKIGPKLFARYITYRSNVFSASWSPDGLHLLTIESQEEVFQRKSRNHRYRLYRYLPSACVMREIKTDLARIHTNSVTASTWISPNEFLSVHEHEGERFVFKYKIDQLEITKSELMKAWWSNAEFDTTRPAYGSLTTSSTGNYFYILAECENHRDRHHKILVFDIRHNQRSLLGVIFVRGIVMQMTPADSRLFFAFREHRTTSFLDNTAYAFFVKATWNAWCCDLQTPWTKTGHNLANRLEATDLFHLWEFNEEDACAYPLFDKTGVKLYTNPNAYSHFEWYPGDPRNPTSDYLTIQKVGEEKFFHVGPHYIVTKRYCGLEAAKVNIIA